MEELIEWKNYADAEEQLRAVDQAMLDLIQRLGGVVAPRSVAVTPRLFPRPGRRGGGYSPVIRCR